MQKRLIQVSVLLFIINVVFSLLVFTFNNSNAALPIPCTHLVSVPEEQCVHCELGGNYLRCGPVSARFTN